MSTPATEPTEQGYLDARQAAIDATVAWLQLGDALGKDQGMMAAEFMVAFQQAAEQALGDG